MFNCITSENIFYLINTEMFVFISDELVQNFLCKHTASNFLLSVWKCNKSLLTTINALEMFIKGKFKLFQHFLFGKTINSVILGLGHNENSRNIACIGRFCE